MGWMDAHEYLIIERTLLDRLDEVERFSLEQAFHSEAADGDDCATEDSARLISGSVRLAVACPAAGTR
jgi:hypothetical protein